MARLRPVPKKVASEEQVQDLARRQAALTALTKHPSWDSLKEEVSIQRGAIERQILRRMIPQVKPAARISEDTLAELYYLRGMVAGMRWLVDAPENAESQLNQWLKDQGLDVEETA